MANQLAEFEEAATLAEQDRKTASNTEKASRAPFFTARLEDAAIRVTAQHASALKVSFFKVDLEILFTLNPFSLEEYRNFSHVQPFLQERIALGPGDNAPLLLPLPAELLGENLFIQLSLSEQGVTQDVFLSHTPFRLQHHLNTDFGILKLVDGDTRKPAPKVYVKCFVRYKSGKTAFYKDGYTDLRGSFDYVSLSKDNLSEIDRFSLMVSGGEFGFKVLQAAVPKSIGRIEGEAKQLVSANWANIQQQCTTKQGVSKYAKLI